ncbi:MAG: hypothetical protein GC206_08325 [Alphaproteobacteria bacterium]|nr:hypothetical protein [Alphaproteobacteria bacterium]
MKDRQDALRAIDAAWPQICGECLAVLGSELHYQAMIYHALRTTGQVPVEQLGMNVKQWIPDVQSELFRHFDLRKREAYRGGFEPIPDIVIFSNSVGGDWRRRRREHTIACMLAVIEVKASERAGKHLSRAEVCADIRKLAAHREEALFLGHDFHPVMLVIDSAREARERMTSVDVLVARDLARELSIEWRYVSPDDCHLDRPCAE